MKPSLRELLKEITATEDVDAARIVAAALNFDRFAIKISSGREGYSAEDIFRLGRILQDYSAIPLDGSDFKPG